ncbi:MAG: hypothetical protein J1G38_02045 [Clostridiales bacterium]|nr:hypothetical protein [Clostridiales bacterium]
MMKKGTKFAIVTAAVAAVGMSLVALAGCSDDAGDNKKPPAGTHPPHTLVAHEQVDATCQKAGTEAYWQCSVCDKYFSDAKGETEIDTPKTIAKKAHSHTVWDYEGDLHWQQCEWCDDITEKEPHTDIDLYVIQAPSKTTYYTGEQLDTTGLKVALECFDECGYSIDVTAKAVVEEVELTTDVTSVKVTYEDDGEEYETSFNITVSELVMTAINVTRKPGVEYYNNGLAVPKPSDFTVVATFNNDSTRTLNEDEYTVTAAQGFTTNGGLITIKPKAVNNLSWEQEYTLVEVVYEKLEIITPPSNLVYRTDEAISLAGLVLAAKYNDGTSDEITKGWTCEEEGKTYDTEGPVTVTVSYTIGEVTHSVEITYTISNDDGDVVSIKFADNAVYTIYAGEAFSADDVELAVYSVHENGRANLLESTAYTITVPQGNAVLGNVYKITATLNDDGSKKVELPVKVLMKYDGNQCVLLDGGKKNTNEKEYIVDEEGTIVQTDRVVPYVGGFVSGGKMNGRAFAAWHFTSTSVTTADLTFRAANSYLRKDDNGYYMEALQINSVADVYVNGAKIDIPDSVVLRGTPYSANYPPVYNIYYTFTIEGITLGAGVNEIAIQFKESTLGQKNSWGETPSTMNIDYVEVSAYGAEYTASTVQSIELSKFSTEPQYGDYFADAQENIIVYGIMADGSRVLLDASEYDVTIPKGDVTKGYFGFGEYTVTVTHKTNKEATFSMDFKFEEYVDFYPVGAGVKIEDNRVYYYFTFLCVGHDDSVFEFFDGDKTFNVAKTDKGPLYTTFYIDVTDWQIGQTYPHVKINGEKYVNDSNASGDIRGPKLVYTNGQTVTLNGKKYKIETAWSMPTLKIENA